MFQPHQPGCPSLLMAPHKAAVCTLFSRAHYKWVVLPAVANSGERHQVSGPVFSYRLLSCVPSVMPCRACGLWPTRQVSPTHKPRGSGYWCVSYPRRRFNDGPQLSPGPGALAALGRSISAAVFWLPFGCLTTVAPTTLAMQALLLHDPGLSRHRCRCAGGLLFSALALPHRAV